MAELPAGTITLLFADIERSTALLQQLGPERYGEALAEYRRLLRDAVTERDGVEVGTEGDGFFAAFPSARQALAGAVAAQEALAAGSLSVRMGLHTGEPLVVDGHYTRDRRTPGGADRCGRSRRASPALAVDTGADRGLRGRS